MRISPLVESRFRGGTRTKAFSIFHSRFSLLDSTRKRNFIRPQGRNAQGATNTETEPVATAFDVRKTQELRSIKLVRIPLTRNAENS